MAKETNKKKKPVRKRATKKVEEIVSKADESSEAVTSEKDEVEYNVEKHPDTGAMRLQELYYLRLLAAEQTVKIYERDLQIAQANVREFQTNANAQLQALQNKVKEINTMLYNSKVLYKNEVDQVEAVTKLSLREWTVDDDRILRPLEKQ